MKLDSFVPDYVFLFFFFCHRQSDAAFNAKRFSHCEKGNWSDCTKNKRQSNLNSKTPLCLFGQNRNNMPIAQTSNIHKQISH